MNDRALDQFLFIALPYVCLFTFLLMTIYRYRQQSFSYSSLSSQFLENKQHFWAVVPFHYGILAVTAGHLIAFLIPRSILAWNSHPLRLYILEISALVCGLLTLIGLISLIARRGTTTRIRKVTTVTDWILFAMLLIQTVSGVAIALFHPWGSSWFATNMSPVSVVHLQIEPRRQFRHGNAAPRQTAYRAGVPDHWFLPFHATSSLTCRS
jgi:nitrate reductase gamma subunit